MLSIAPTVGRTVLYTLTDQDATAINRRRVVSSAPLLTSRVTDGNQLHVGNAVRAGQVYPLIITRVWGTDPTSAVNGQVMLDGNDSYWVCSVVVGEGPGHYVWPRPIV